MGSAADGSAGRPGRAGERDPGWLRELRAGVRQSSGAAAIKGCFCRLPRSPDHALLSVWARGRSCRRGTGESGTRCHSGSERPADAEGSLPSGCLLLSGGGSAPLLQDFPALVAIVSF